MPQHADGTPMSGHGGPPNKLRIPEVVAKPQKQPKTAEEMVNNIMRGGVRRS